MVDIELREGGGTFVDSLFSLGVNLIQHTAVKVGVMVKTKRHFRRRPGPTQDFQRRLQELGLVPERLWWGPMTFEPNKCQFLMAEIESQPPKRLLEVGSGTSTAVFAALAENYGFSVLSLENHGGTVKYVQSILEGLPCSKRVTIQKCDFVRRTYPNGEKYWWYNADLGSVGGLFDFVFIDGPMGTFVGRNGALPEIKGYLAEDHRIYLDDIKRPHERSCLEEWERHFPTLTFEKCPGTLGRLTV